MSDTTQRGFPRGADTTPDAIELRNHVVATSPNTIGVYSPKDRITHIFVRRGDVRDGYTWYSYGLTPGTHPGRSSKDKSKDRPTSTTRAISLLNTEQTNLEGLLYMYDTIDTPIPDMSTQYEVYRKRISNTSPSYPGDLLLRWHSSTVAASPGTHERQLYLAALLGVDPLEAFGVTTSAGEERVGHLLGRIDELVPLLRRDLDRRGAW